MGAYVVGFIVLATLYRQEGRKGWVCFYLALAIVAFIAQLVIEVV